MIAPKLITLVLLAVIRFLEGQDVTLSSIKDACDKKSKGCFFGPKGCDLTTSCVLGVTYAKTSDTTMTFEMFAKQAPNSGGGLYVALGLSLDGSMGTDGVTECVHDGSNTNLYLSYNSGHLPPERVNLPVSEQPKLSYGAMDNGYLFCKFEQLIASSNDKVFALNKSYNLLLATGVASSSGISKHTGYGTATGPVVSGKVTPTEQVSAEAPATYLSPTTKRSLKKAHGICMILGWFLFVASAILFARYCKKLWPDTKIAGIGIWFQMHRGLNLFGVLLIAAAFICIFVAEEGKWEGPKPGDDFSKVPKDPGALHSLLGLTAAIIAFVQPIISLMRCSPTDAKRPIFNWIHRFLGITGWCLAATAIWLVTSEDFSFGLSAKRDGITGRAIIIFYWVSLVVAVTIMEIHAWATEWCVRSNKLQEVPLQPMASGHKPPTPPYIDTRPKLGIIRTAVLIFFMVIALGVTVALAVLIGLS